MSKLSGPGASGCLSAHMAPRIVAVEGGVPAETQVLAAHTPPTLGDAGPRAVGGPKAAKRRGGRKAPASGKGGRSCNRLGMLTQPPACASGLPAARRLRAFCVCGGCNSMQTRAA